jgi:plastocyanin
LARVRSGLPILLAGVIVGVLAMAAVWMLRTRDDAPGRVVEAGPPEAYRHREPILFALDDFYLMSLEGGEFVALYAYPPGYFGHVRGCRIRWEPDATYQGYHAGTGATPAPVSQQTLVEATGLWVEGCGGSKWDASGRRLFGPAPRDLDRFPVNLTAEGNIRIDTRRLQCSGEPCERVRAEGSGLIVLIMSPMPAREERVLGPGDGMTNVIPARDNAFGAAILRATAAQVYRLTLVNTGESLHSWHLLGVEDVEGTPIATPLVISGQMETISFTVAAPGTYAFQCDVHPVEMQGHLIVQ